MKPIDELEAPLRQRLEKLRPTPERDPEKAALGRANYLAQVKALAQQKSPSPVSETLPRRLNLWVHNLIHSIRRKERFSMASLITTLIVTLTLLLGGTGVTVYAARDSLPNDMLYPVKTFSEEVQLRLTLQPQQQLDLLLRFADRRLDEILRLQREGEPVPAGVAIRLERELQMALQVAAQMDEPVTAQALEQIRLRISAQEQRMAMLQSKTPPIVEPVWERVRAILREQMEAVEAGLADPATFRLRWRERHNQPPTPFPLEETLPPATPTPDGSGFGPGPQPTPICEACTPVLDGTGPGPGPQHGGATAQPTQAPGSGPQATPTCTPLMDGSGPGPGPRKQSPTPQPTTSPAPEATFMPTHDMGGWPTSQPSPTQGHGGGGQEGPGGGGSGRP